MNTLHRLLHAGREAVELSQAELALASGVSTRTINRMEAEDAIVGFAILAKIRNCLETRGLKFIEPTETRDWTLMFDLAIAPAPEPELAKNRVFDPAPGCVLRAARTVLGLAQVELGQRAEIAHTTVRKLERNGKVEPESSYRLQAYLETVGIKIVKPQGGDGWRLYCRSM
ncbi:XRE family transcriptional regulator [Rhizobium ruizarguesonis]|uniref:helix-turn-helix domain-containing protein n=1 Tax=Rhizobium ruizarguesonis TaxID=2081791 RepID=UPI0010302667|nr:helix-turn-helix transcriptional regulator [Rhizobium ruizarguesonis]TAW57483.1 XRE family transcriptional regulator [Rhizobium ruizarguesonis]